MTNQPLADAGEKPYIQRARTGWWTFIAGLLTGVTWATWLAAHWKPPTESTWMFTAVLAAWATWHAVVYWRELPETTVNSGWEREPKERKP